MSGKLNCRQGDLAITINSPANGGRIVNVLEFFASCGHGEFWIVESIGSEFNVVRSTGAPNGRAKKMVWPDHNLRPIRDRPGDDQTLTWAGKPEHYAMIQRARKPFSREFTDDAQMQSLPCGF